MNSISLRIQVCPKKGIISTSCDLGMGFRPSNLLDPGGVCILRICLLRSSQDRHQDLKEEKEVTGEHFLGISVWGAAPGK